MDTITNLLPEIQLFGSVIYFWLLTIGAVVLLAIAEHNLSWGGFISICIGFVLLTSNYSDFSVFSSISIPRVLGYLGIGLLYALVRTYFFGRKTIGKEHELKERVFMWWLLFPISIINWIISDLVQDVYNYIYSKTEFLFTAIYKSGNAKPKEN